MLLEMEMGSEQECRNAVENTAGIDEAMELLLTKQMQGMHSM